MQSLGFGLDDAPTPALQLEEPGWYFLDGGADVVQIMQWNSLRCQQILDAFVGRLWRFCSKAKFY